MSYAHQAGKKLETEGGGNADQDDHGGGEHAGVSSDYFPPAESRGGWRYLEGAVAAKAEAGIDLHALEQLFELQVINMQPP